MRIAFVSEEDKGLNSIVSSRFGRDRYFIILDLDGSDIRDLRIEVNPGSEAKSGAGIKAVQKLINERVDVVVAGAFGPNSTAALEEMGIKYVEMSGITVEEALRRLRDRLSL